MVMANITQVYELEVTLGVEHHVIAGEVVVAVAKLMQRSQSNRELTDVQLQVHLWESLESVDERAQSFAWQILENPKEAGGSSKASLELAEELRVNAFLVRTGVPSSSRSSLIDSS